MSKFKLNFPQILAIVILFYSCLVMAGWIFNLDSLTRILPNSIQMQFMTAFTFFLSAVALMAIDLTIGGNREISQLILPETSISILLIMATLFVGGLTGVQTGIQGLFVEGNMVTAVIPGMPAIPTMINFILFSIASIIVLFEPPKLKRRLLYLAIPIILVGLVACFGYIFNIPFLYYQISKVSNPMAFNTAIVFVFLGSGLILTNESQKHENKP